MKLRVHIKDPDGFSDSISDTVQAQLQALDLPRDEREALYDAKAEKLSSFLEQWVEYDECMVIEFDTDDNTATVLKR
jgi:hypothetical protein